ncbi:MAG: hypothetical protein V4678_00135 [Patescibacteria group bacterium]
MATKKTTTKKTPVKKKAAVTRKATPKRKSAGKRAALRSHIGLQAEETAFMTFRITKQTVYWLVLGAVVIVFTLWLARLQSEIQTIYDQIDANTVEMSQL